MFKQIQSAIIWTYIYKFRKFLLQILVVIVLFFFVEYFYRDIVEYLTISGHKDKIFYLLLAKWAIFMLLISFLSVRLYTILKKTKKPPNPRKLSKKEIAKLAQQIIEAKKR